MNPLRFSPAAERQPLSEGADTLHRLLMQAPVAITVLQAHDGTIELANTCQLRLWGREAEEVTGKPLHEVFPGAQLWQNILHEVVQSGERATLNEWSITLPTNGLVETFLFDLSFEPLANERGEVERIMIVSTDVTRSVVERRKAEAGAGALHSLANALPQLVWIAGPDGTVTYYNDQVAQFAGAEQQADGSWRWEGLLHPEDILPTAEAWQDAVATGKVYEKEHRVNMKDGSWRWHLSRGFPHRNAKGEVIQWYGTATDIHGVKLAEENLAYQKGLLETVTRNTTGALFMLDSACCLVYQNDAAMRMTGYSFGELKGKNLHAHIHHTRPDGSLYPQEECPLAAVLRDCRQATGEEVFNRKDGTLFPVYYAVSPIVVDGASVGMVMEVRDATEEKKVQQALQESEERLRVATAAAGIGTWSYDIVRNVVHASDQYKRLFGLSPHREMTYELFVSAVLEEDRARTDAVNRAVIEMQAGQTDYEWEYRVRGIEDGQLRWLRARGKVYPGPDGKPHRFAGAVMDITREKETELSLAYRKALLEAQNNTIPDGLLVVDTKGGMLSYNRSFAQIWGMPQQIMEAGDDHAALAFAMTQVRDPQAFIDRVNYLYSHATEAAREEIELKDGRILERYGNAVIDEQNVCYGWAWYFRDITDQKQFTERLEALVRQRTIELQSSNHDLQQFAHVASHDLKEPLRKIRTFASRLAEDKESHLSERGRVYLEKVESAAGRMSNMIEGVLAYSTVSASWEAPQPVNLAAVVHDISSDLEVLIQQKDAKLTAGDLPVVMGAPVLIHQLFYNLFNNSLKFARPGVPPRIEISASTVHTGGGAFARVVVRDNGIGFGPEHAEAIFGTFTRLNPKDQFEGTGLGLSLCKKIVERHGGTITAVGKEGEGATFTVTLPLHSGSL